jgi:hypothetical protein
MNWRRPASISALEAFMLSGWPKRDTESLVIEATPETKLVASSCHHSRGKSLMQINLRQLEFEREQLLRVLTCIKADQRNLLRHELMRASDL